MCMRWGEGGIFRFLPLSHSFKAATVNLWGAWGGDISEVLQLVGIYGDLRVDDNRWSAGRNGAIASEGSGRNDKQCQ